MITKEEIELERLKYKMRQLSDRIRVAQDSGDAIAVRNLLTTFQGYTRRRLALELGLNGK